MLKKQHTTEIRVKLNSFILTDDIEIESNLSKAVISQLRRAFTDSFGDTVCKEEKEELKSRN